MAKESEPIEKMYLLKETKESFKDRLGVYRDDQSFLSFSEVY